MMAKVGICLSGCGFLDGSEIQESVLTVLALDQAGAEIHFFAPNAQQVDVVDHLAQQPSPDQIRNGLVESARIARGAIQDLAEVSGDQLDGVIFPGGFGAAKLLCGFAIDGPQCEVNPEVERLVGEMFEAKKPIGALCIAPALIARILGQRGAHPRLTIGNDRPTAEAIEAMGGRHVECIATECVVDEELKVVTTPAYMVAKGSAEVYEGARKLVGHLLRLAGVESAEVGESINK
jgi:enhancing lycopene biosynthesis protein 2